MPRWLRNAGWTVAYLAVWTLFGLIAASQGLIWMLGGEVEGSVVLLRLTFVRWYSWALVVPVVYLLAERFPVERPHRLWRVVFHAFLGAGVSVLVAGLRMVGRPLLGLGPPFSSPFFSWVHAYRRFAAEAVFYLGNNLLTYASLVALAHVWFYFRAVRRRELRAAELQTQLAEARLAALRSQLHPHFLFNALNGISGLVRSRPEVAEDMLAELAELLRRPVHNPAEHETSLAEELRFTDRYLKLQGMRFGDRLRVRREVSAAALDARVPALVLQPLVENAIEHGAGRRLAGGTLEIAAAVRDGTLELRVADDGPGLAGDAGPESWGVGLRNTAERLAQLHGDRARLELESPESGGLTVRVTLPYRPAEAGEKGDREAAGEAAA
jgi:signal transduction histidine kinase